METKWQKLLFREGVDITTVSGIEQACNQAAWQFAHKKREFFFTFCHQGWIYRYTRVDLDGFGKFLYQKYFNNPAKIEKLYYKGERFKRNIISTTNKYRKSLTFKSDNRDIILAFDEFNKQFEVINSIYSMYAWFAIRYWEKVFRERLLPLLEKSFYRHNIHQVVASILNRPWKKTALIKLADDLDKGTNLKLLVNKYQFLRSWSIIWYQPLTTKWFKEIKQKRGINRYHSLSTILKRIDISKKEERILLLAPYIIFLKDYRDELRRFQVYYWLFLFEIIAQRFGVETSDLGFLTLAEIKKAIIKDRLDSANIFRRKKWGCVVGFDQSRNNFFVKNGLPKKYKNIIDAINSKKLKSNLKGMGAYPGKVKGRVFIIDSLAKLKRMRRGFILVSVTTHPNYLPAMKIAKAIITDEGGITSHAAIVAREFKIPCIVGTKVATKVLQDGDLVEVDAEKGVVLKLK